MLGSRPVGLRLVLVEALVPTLSTHTPGGEERLGVSRQGAVRSTGLGREPLS